MWRVAFFFKQRSNAAVYLISLRRTFLIVKPHATPYRSRKQIYLLFYLSFSQNIDSTSARIMLAWISKQKTSSRCVMQAQKINSAAWQKVHFIWLIKSAIRWFNFIARLSNYRGNSKSSQLGSCLVHARPGCFSFASKCQMRKCFLKKL